MSVGWRATDTEEMFSKLCYKRAVRIWELVFSAKLYLYTEFDFCHVKEELLRLETSLSDVLSTKSVPDELVFTDMDEWKLFSRKKTTIKILYYFKRVNIFQSRRFHRF